MKLDKETVVAIAICLVILFAWDPICNMIWPPKPVKKQEQVEKKVSKDKPSISEQTVHTKTEKDSSPDKKGTTSVSEISEELKNKPKTAESPLKSTKTTPETGETPSGIIVKTHKEYSPLFIENDEIRAEIDQIYGKISFLVLKDYYKSDIKTFQKTNENIILFSKLKDGALKLESGSTWEFDKVTSAAQVNKNELKLTRSFKSADGFPFTITQYWKADKNYTISYKIEINNTSKEHPLNIQGLRISDGGLPNIHELANDKIPFRESHEITYYDPDSEKFYSKEAQLKPGFFSNMFGSGGKIKDKSKTFQQTLKVKASWIAVSNKYFATLLVPQDFNFTSLVLKSEVFPKEIVERGVQDYTVAEVNGIINNISIKPQESYNASFKYYVGPKKIEYLRELHPAATKIMRLYMLGMKFLEPLSRLMLSALLWLQSLCGSYGLSIILLTIIVKGLLWPVTHKANASMRKMQKINPLIQELRKKYKNDHQKLNVEMMKLYKEHKVNPFGGCLPILLQMPIFFALYSALSGAVEPRHTAFLWIHDLTLPDTIANIAGIPINPLMLLMTGTMILQQKITPSAADPAQQRMMMFMPLLMLVMLYSLPSGLTLYWTVSQLISIAQLIVNRKLEQKAESLAT